jgi:hypothetical protein
MTGRLGFGKWAPRRVGIAVLSKEGTTNLDDALRPLVRTLLDETEFRIRVE